ncbi:MAG TPA: hypothetical protein PL037_06265, partial [Elusimicrobiales bacterium]|nr:hypothetical protein [Elusimicrobiales bacterium]
MALVFSVFSRSLGAGFLNWDDPDNFLNNTGYRGLGPGHLRWMFTTCGMGPYSPLMWLSACADHAVWGMDAFGWHLSNVLLHSANAAVFYLLCRRLLTAVSGLSENVAEISFSAVMAALFFALHPLCVETVAWASTRPNLLLTFFYQLAILSYIMARGTGGESASWPRRQALPLFFFLLSLLSKGTAVTLPLVLILLDVYPLGRLPSEPRRWVDAGNRGVLAEKLPYFALSLVFGAAAFMCQARIGTIVPMEKFGLASRAAQALYGLAFYPLKTILPLDLLPYYQLPEGFGLFSWGTLMRGAAVAGVTAAAVAVRRRSPVFTAVWAYYLLTVWPMAGVVKINEYWAADRYAYIACLGFAVLAGAGILSILRSGRGVRRT